MTKDRFKELQENIEKYGDGVDIRILNHFAVIDMEAPLMNDFFQEVNSLRSIINKIKELVDDVEHLQHVMLTPPIAIGTKEKLEGKMSEIKLLGHDVRMKLKQMKQIQEMQNPTGEQNVRQRIIESQIEVMTKTFCAIMDQYYQSTMTYRQRCIERIRRQSQLVKTVKTDDEIEELLYNEHLTLFPEIIIIETKQAKEKFDEMELRHQELIKLENSIRELHDMFFDVARLATLDGNLITYIDNKTRDTAAKVVKTKDIIPAEKVPHCFNSKKKIGLIFGLIIIAIISIVYFI